METPRGRHLLTVLMAVFVIAAFTGCATSPASAPASLSVNDLLAVSGHWAGDCNFGSGREACHILIGPSGTFTAISGSNTVFGTVKQAGNRAVFDAGSRSGDIALYENQSCRRGIEVKSAAGNVGRLTQDGPAARQVGSLANVVGRWAGTCDLGAGLVPCRVVIGQDGAFAASAGANSTVGRVTVANGMASFASATGGTGDIVLHEGTGCPRQIAVVGTRTKGFILTAE